MSDPEAPKKATRRYDFLLVYSVLPRNPKVARLKDSEFRAYVYALCAAREEQERGEWIDRSYVQAALGKYGKHVPALIESTLLIEEPNGRVRVRQWSLWQPKDPTAAARKQEQRERDAERASHEAVTPSHDVSRIGEGTVGDAEATVGEASLCIGCGDPIRDGYGKTGYHYWCKPKDQTA